MAQSVVFILKRAVKMCFNDLVLQPELIKFAVDEKEWQHIDGGAACSSVCAGGVDAVSSSPSPLRRDDGLCVLYVAVARRMRS